MKDIKFIRIRLFFLMLFMAFYSLFNPAEACQMLEDHDEANRVRRMSETVERIRRFSKKKAHSG